MTKARTLADNFAADINGITAGTGITGGGTSGTVTVTNSMATIIDAKGDLVGGTGADTFARLAVGANDTVLTADSAQATGLKWATPAAGGMTLLSTTTLSGASTTVSGISSAYKDLYVVIRDHLTASDQTQLLMTFNGDTTGNRHADRRNYNFGGGSAGSFNSTSFWLADSIDNTVTQGLIVFTIPDYTNTITWKMAFGYSISTNGSNTAQFTNTQIMGFYNQTDAISSLQFSAATGNLTSGTVLIYGVK
jgi:hypothetical protein